MFRYIKMVYHSTLVYSMVDISIRSSAELAMMSVPTRSPYVFSKYALRGFSDVLRYEMEGFGVKVSKFLTF